MASVVAFNSTLAGGRLLTLAVISAPGQKGKAPQDQALRKSDISSWPIPRCATNLANPKQTQKLPSGARKELPSPLRVSMRPGGKTMQRFCHRIVIAALTSLMFIPLGMQAQEQSKDQSSQTAKPSNGKDAVPPRNASASTWRCWPRNLALLTRKKRSFSRSAGTCGSRAWLSARTVH